MIVIGAPMPGDVLQAQKREKPQKEIHGEGFREIFEEALCREKERTNVEGAQNVSVAAGRINISSI